MRDARVASCRSLLAFEGIEVVDSDQQPVGNHEGAGSVHHRPRSRAVS
jgi:hypothetical protein